MDQEEQVSFSFTVEPDVGGQRLDAVLARRYPQVPRARWQERIRAGTVLVAEKACRPSRKLKAGEHVAFSFLRRAEPEVNRNYSILYQDEDLLVINKPADLPVHPSGVYHKHTLHGLLLERFGQDFTAHFAHRLDRETSGLIVLGMNRDAARHLGQAFRTRDSVHKEYLAIVEGEFPLRVDARGFIGVDELSIVRKKQRFTPQDAKGPPPPDARPCRTILRRAAVTAHGSSLVHALLLSGRLHQIRATLSSLGYPMVGDRLYGVDDSLYLRFIADEETSEDRARLRMNRSALHCRRLRLAHPRTGHPMVFRAPLPEDMTRLVLGTPPQEFLRRPART